MFCLLVFGCIVKEIPAFWRSKLIKVFAFFDFFIFDFLVLSSFIFFNKFLLIHYSFRFIKINLTFNLFHLFYFFKAFQKNCIFNILQNMNIDMLEHFSSIEPLLLIFFIKVAIPYPMSAINFSFCFFLSLQSLLFCHKLLISIFVFFFKSWCNYFFVSHFGEIFWNIRWACFFVESLSLFFKLGSLSLCFFSQLNFSDSHYCFISSQFWYHIINYSLVHVQ